METRVLIQLEDKLKTIYGEHKVVNNMHAKYQLHPIMVFRKKDFLNIFYEKLPPFVPPRQSIKMSDLDKIHMKCTINIFVKSDSK